ncbi:hydrolase [Glaciecola siphonariae]|uniref:Hydrolase n=1 Tax=Glaciecola siphonariae TaxID=521012 RepID=A0ABV9LSZ6_9ALTE
MKLPQTSVSETKYGRISTSSFRAPRWAQNPHLQTIFPKYAMRTPNVDFKNVRIDTPDKDFLDLAVCSPQAMKQPKAVVALFHGLEGSKKSHYIQHLAYRLQQNGIVSVLMHFRGCSGEINRQARAYHSGETSDAKHFFLWIKKTYPQVPMFAVGFSLGGNMLLKLLGEQQDDTIKAAVSISAPIDLAASSQAINHGFARHYQAHLLSSMRQNLINKMKVIDMRPNVQLSPADVAKLNSFRLFDEYVTSVLHGFKNADDYYEKCSAMQYIQHIKTPTLIMHSLDDPFMDSRVVPLPCALSDYTAYELSSHGGHVGFMSGSMLSPNLYLPERILNFIQEHL